MKIELRNVSFGYSKDSEILHDISFEIDGPGLICIIGPNGVGKSTIVKCMDKILTPTKGEILINDVDIKTMKTRDIAKIVGYVPPFSEDFFSMTVIDTILIGRHNHQKWKTTAEDLEMVQRVMSLVGVEQFAMRSFNELSAGQHQKVVIARGIIEETDILILDEPTSNLDVRHQVYIMELLRCLAEASGKMIIMISHDLNLAAKYAHKLILMSRPGIVKAIGTSEEIITKKNIEDVYQVECDIIEHNGRPTVLLGSPIIDENNVE